MDEVLNTYLKDLLVLHDCVILPGFGGFVGSYKSAKRTDKDYFTPPRKVIAFNQQLKQNDGLLANTIVAIEKISYEEAMQHVTTFVANIKEELSTKGSYTIKGIGELKVGEQEKILFTPDTTTNFLHLPTGMSSFQFAPQVQLKPVLPPPVTKEKEAVLLFPIFRKMLVAGVSGLALFSLLLNPGKFEYLSLASIFPTYETEQSIDSQENTVPKTETNEERDLDAKPNEATEEIDNNEPEATQSNKSEEITTTSNELVVEKRYHVIVGCFSMRKNAKVLQKQLEARNISSQIFTYNYMLTGVSAGSFENFAKAKVVMDRLRDSGDAPGAWVLKRKNLN